MTESSSDPEMRERPSGDHATAFTDLACPSISMRDSPVTESKIEIVCPAELQAIRLPPGDQAA